MSPAVDLALGVILCAIFVVGLVSSVVTERRNRTIIRERLAQPDRTVPALPFVPVDGNHPGFGRGYSGGFCPDDRAAPKTPPPGSLSARLQDRAVSA
jgi:hypothetical protein